MVWTPLGAQADSAVGFDAELLTRPVPVSMARRYGDASAFWWAWTAAEAVAKAVDLPILAFLHRHGLDPVRPPAGGAAEYQVEIEDMRLLLAHHRVGEDVLVCTARVVVGARG